MEDVSVQNVSVLRAGITKFLQSGKNKIILNLVDAKQLSMDVIREIVKLHMVAAELKGEIVLVGQGDMVKQAILSFSTPPPIRYFPTKEAAIGALSETASVAKTPGEPPPLGDNLAALKHKLAKLEAENKSLKSKLATCDVTAARKLRFENGVFQQQVKALDEQLKFIAKDRKKPFEMESVQSKIIQLEEALASLLQKEGLVSK